MRSFSEHYDERHSTKFERFAKQNKNCWFFNWFSAISRQLQARDTLRNTFPTKDHARRHTPSVKPTGTQNTKTPIAKNTPD